MATLPANVSFGTITGRFLTAEQLDLSASDPDASPVKGTVTFTASPASLRNVGAQSVILPKPIKVALDKDTGAFTARLVATDDTDLNPVDWTYTVSFAFDNATPPPPFSISVPAGTTQDLSSLMPVASARGTFYVVPDIATQAIADSQAAAADADAAAASAASAATAAGNSASAASSSASSAASSAALVGAPAGSAIDAHVGPTLISSGTGDQTAALNAFFASSAPAGVKRLIGTFNVSDRIIVPTGTKIEGWAATIVQTGTNKITIDADGASNVRITGLTLVGKATDYVSGGSPVAIGIRVRNGSNAIINHCTLTGHAGASIRVEGYTEATVAHNRITGTSPASGDGTQYGVLLESACLRIRVEGNIINATAQGVIASVATTDIQIVGNMIYGITGQHAMYLQNGTRTQVVSNWVKGTNNQGIKCQLAPSSTMDGVGLEVSNNLLDGTGSHSILLINTDPAVAYRLRGVSVSGNVITNAGDDGLNLNNITGGSVANNVIRGARAGATFVDCVGLTVNGNRFSSTLSEGMKLDKVSDSQFFQNRITDPAASNGTTTEMGIRITTTSADLRFVDNIVSDSLGNMRYALYVEAGPDQASMSFRNNRGTGATDYGARLQAGVAVREWSGNEFTGTLGAVLNLPADFSKGGVKNVTYGAAAPTTGTWNRGDVVWNTAPAASGTVGWVCTGGGTPGTWKTFGGIAA